MSFSPVRFLYKLFLVFDINPEEAEESFISSKSDLDRVLDEKKKIEALAKFKKARARFL